MAARASASAVAAMAAAAVAAAALTQTHRLVEAALELVATEEQKRLIPHRADSRDAHE